MHALDKFETSVILNNASFMFLIGDNEITTIIDFINDFIAVQV